MDSPHSVGNDRVGCEEGLNIEEDSCTASKNGFLTWVAILLLSDDVKGIG